MNSLPTFADVQAAARRLEGVAIRTPLLENARVNDRLGGRLFLKAECLQRTGSFKIRGAYNFLASMNDADRRKGAVGWSSGNHAQGLAEAGRLLGVKTTIVMPADAPALKVANTRASGAEVVLYDRVKESREEIGTAIASKTGATIVPPYDHPWILTGQGTAGLELAEQAKALGVTLETLERDVVRNPLAPRIVYEGMKFPTPTGRAQLMTSLPGEAEPLTSEFPLRLMAVSTERSQSSQWARVPEGELSVTVHPASAPGLADGSVVRLVSSVGELKVRLKLDDRQRRDVALMPKGGHLSRGQCANAITSARVSPTITPISVMPADTMAWASPSRTSCAATSRMRAACSTLSIRMTASSSVLPTTVTPWLANRKA